VGVKVISVPQGADGGARGTSLKEVELTAAKKSPAGTKKVAPAKKVAAAKKAVPAARTSSSPAKKATTAKARSATAPKKKATVTKSIPAKKTAPATKKAAPAAKAATKAAPAAKAAAKKAPAAKTPAKKAPGATKVAPTKKSAPAPAPVPAPSPAPVKAVKKAVPEPPKRPTVGPYVKDVKFLDAQRVLLHEERTIYSGQAIDLRAEADSLALEREPGDVQFDEESGEGGTVTVDRERNLALSAQAAAAVEEIDDALKKLDRKSYGWCERCYQPIPKARLQALPFARLCVACKSGGLSRR
jgi:DnaK suppressor protein